MPHLKVKPFDLNSIDNKIDGFIKFRAKLDSSDLIFVEYNANRLFLDIIKRDNEYLIKPNKITKVANSNILKEVLNRFAKELDLVILHSNTNIRPYKPKVTNKALKSIEYFYDFDSTFSKIKLEVGFGSGRHLLYRALEEKDTLFIGVEIHTPSIEQVLKQIELKGVENILIVNYDARLLLEMLPSNILDTIYVHFPVPWDKKPHRRVISEFFINEALRVLKKGASLELRTDSPNYYKYALEVFSIPKISSFKVDKNRDIEVISKYEARWRRMNKDIFTLTLTSLEESDSKVEDIDFSFEKLSSIDIEFPKSSIVKSDFFVHFGKVWRVSDGFVVEVSFGSFDIPEKKMLVCRGDECFYLPSAPVKSSLNYKAHNLIKEVLNGKCN